MFHISCPSILFVPLLCTECHSALSIGFSRHEFLHGGNVVCDLENPRSDSIVPFQGFEEITLIPFIVCKISFQLYLNDKSRLVTPQYIDLSLLLPRTCRTLLIPKFFFFFFSLGGRHALLLETWNEASNKMFNSKVNSFFYGIGNIIIHIQLSV